MNLIKSGIIAVAFAIVLGCQPSAKSQFRPFGRIEHPPDDVVFAQGHSAWAPSLSGWALSEDGVSRIWIFMDRRFYREVRPMLARPELKSSFPTIPSASHAGWTMELDVVGIQAGRHEVVVQAVGRNGLIADLGVVHLNISH